MADEVIERERKAWSEGYALRMSLHLRVQHICFAACVATLAATGLVLLMPDADLARWVVAVEGGFENRGLIHRAAALGLIACFLWHLGYSFLSGSGSREFRRRRLGAEDFRNFAAAVRYGLALTGTRPNIGKYALGQKLHYWLSGFLAGTMILTGLALWSPTATLALVTKDTFLVLRTLHGYEGLLLFVAVILWHLYDAHLSPRHFPMSMVWLTGRMPKDKVRELHPAEYRRLEEPGDE